MSAVLASAPLQTQADFQVLVARLFDGLLTPASTLALLPILALSAGVLLLLLTEIAERLRFLRGPLFLASLGASAWGLLRIHQDAPGAVLHGSFLADQRFALWGAMFLCCTLLAWLYSRRYFLSEGSSFLGEYDVLLLCTPVGMLMMVGATELLTFFIGLELLSIPLYVLAGFRRSRQVSVEAAMKYFLLGAFAAALFLYGSALLYTDTGKLDFEGLRQVGVGTPLAICGIALIASSAFFKASVFPFHMWVPDVYQGSPTPVAGLMATGTKAAAFGFLINASFLLPRESATLVAVIAIVTLALGNLGALAQTDLKRLLAYSGIAHAGTMLLAIAGYLGGDTQDSGASQAVLYYMAAYVFTGSGAFGVLALLEAEGEAMTKLSSLRGLGRRRPVLALALALFMLSLGGLPLTGGFLGKWLVFAVLVRADMLLFAVLGALLSVVALGYYLRVVIDMWMQEAPEGAPHPSGENRLGANLATALCAAGVLVLGVLPGLLLDVLP